MQLNMQTILFVKHIFRSVNLKYAELVGNLKQRKRILKEAE